MAQAAGSSTMPSMTVLINKNSKWYTELQEICSQGYKTRTVTTFGQNLDVMVQSRPKQIVCVINGADLLFEWKRTEQVRSEFLFPERDGTISKWHRFRG